MGESTLGLDFRRVEHESSSSINHVTMGQSSFLVSLAGKISLPTVWELLGKYLKAFC